VTQYEVAAALGISRGLVVYYEKSAIAKLRVALGLCAPGSERGIPRNRLRRPPGRCRRCGELGHRAKTCRERAR
jgi:hypothetical protein